MLDIKLVELLPIQAEVNKVVIERLGRDIAPEEFILALNIEFFEFFNTVGVWKWWKQSHKIDRERILDELADCFAFFLSMIELADRKKLVEVPEGYNIAEAYERDVKKVYEDLQFVSNENQDKIEHIKNLILIVGTDNETETITSSIHRFAIAIFIVQLLFENITWEEIVEAYKLKSGVNIQRQETNY